MASHRVSSHVVATAVRLNSSGV